MRGRGRGGRRKREEGGHIPVLQHIKVYIWQQALHNTAHRKSHIRIRPNKLNLVVVNSPSYNAITIVDQKVGFCFHLEICRAYIFPVMPQGKQGAQSHITCNFASRVKTEGVCESHNCNG